MLISFFSITPWMTLITGRTAINIPGHFPVVTVHLILAMFMAINAGKNGIVISLIMTGCTGTPDPLVGTRVNGEIGFVFPKIGGLPADKLVTKIALCWKTAGCMGRSACVLIVR